MLTALVRWTGVVDDAALNSKITTLGQGALLVWALDELVRGTNPLRRLLGFVVLAAQLLLIFT